MSKKKKLTAHEKKLELAKASAPRYGIYIDGGNIERLVEAIQIIEPLVLGVIDSDSEEKTKRDAISLIREAVPSVRGASITNTNITIPD